jgi:Protein of unknown function (DUF3631)
MTVDELLAKHGIKLASTAPGRYYTTCPQCSAGRASKEHRAAKVLGVTIEADGGVHWGCNHCSWTGPEKGTGAASVGPRDLQSHIYRDKDGVVRFRKVRNAPGREPRFWLERADERGGWVKGAKDVNTKIIYRINEVTKAITDGRVIACVEGEKDADNLWSLGIAATCNAHGASEPGKRPKWTKAHSEQLAGADLVVFNDNDAAGYEHADVTCKLSVGVATRVRRLDLKPHWSDIPKGGDISDWLAAGHTREDLDKLIADAPDYQLSAQARQESAGNETAGNGGTIDDAAELEKLARMTPLDYERARKDAGKRLGISRLSLLDGLVKAKRTELGLEGGDGLQGHAIEFPDPEPWPELVDGAALLDGLAKDIRKHVVMSDAARDACVLWVVHSYLLDRLMITPRLGIHSPVKGCGKTTLLDVIGQLVFRPLPAANCSASSIFRVVEGFRPCLLIDEADSFLRDNEELRGVLNSGHRRGGAVLRNVGDDHEPRAFSTYSAVAIALIGQLPGTLADRSVTIDLTRRKPDEAIEPFRFDRVEHLAELARKLMRWTADNAEAIAATEPQMPAGLYNRTADNWRPLLAIATAAGGDWLARGHKAALASANADVDEMSRLELLLGDVRDVFDGLISDVDGISSAQERISSAHLIEKLCAIVPRPWGEYGKRKKPLTQNQLARLLKPLAIVPQKARIGTETPNGYYRHQFVEAWERFLSPTGEFKPEHRNKCDEMGTSDLFQSGTAETDVPVRKCEKSNNDGLCSSVPVGKGELGEWARASNGNGRAPGLSRRTITELAEDYTETAYRQNNEGVGIDSRALDANLRRRLAEMVLPEFVEVEFDRVMAEVFRV